MCLLLIYYLVSFVFLMLWFVESSLEMDAFELLDSYADKLAIVMPHNLVVNKLKRSILLEEVLQVQV